MHWKRSSQACIAIHPQFSTNPYWGEEITMGPGPPRKKADKNCSQAALNPVGLETGNVNSSANSYTMSTGTGTASSPTAVEGSRTSGEGWNRKRYQREDEALWGHDTPGPGQRIFDAIARAGSTAGRLLEGRLNKGTGSEDENPRSYYLAKNPPVNDLHPPVVSTQPANRDETRWMLQPPPPAKVMEGKERVNRIRAVSTGSSRRGPDGSPLSRPVTEKLDEVKEQRIETILPLETETALPRQESSRLMGQLDEKTVPTARVSETGESLSRMKQHPPGVSLYPAAGSLDTVKRMPVSPSSTSDPTNAKDRPRARKENEGPAALREISAVSSNSVMNARGSSSNRLSPNANSMPVTIPSVESRFPGIPGSVFAKPAAVEKNGRAGLGIDLDTAMAAQPPEVR